MASFTVLEQSSIGKSPNRPCEDALVVTAHHAAVIDGATTPHAVATDGRTSGKVASDAVATALLNLPPHATIDDFLAAAHAQIKNEATTGGIDADLPTAVAVVYSAPHRQLWVVGDAHWHVSGLPAPANRRRVIDDLAIAARGVILRAALAAGASIEQLRATDPGRAGTQALREAKATFRNRVDAGDLGFAVLTAGSTTPRELVDVVQVPAGSAVVLATDGYPAPAATLQAAEELLTHGLATDPLCIGELAATKCAPAGALSYDDRTYLRLQTA